MSWFAIAVLIWVGIALSAIWGVVTEDLRERRLAVRLQRAAEVAESDDDFHEYAADPDPFDWSADALDTYAKWESSRDLADPFAMTRVQIAALETTEEHR